MQHIKSLIENVYVFSVSKGNLYRCYLNYAYYLDLGPVVQSIVSLTSSLRVISLTVLADSIYNILIFFFLKKCE